MCRRYVTKIGNKVGGAQEFMQTHCFAMFEAGRIDRSVQVLLHNNPNNQYLIPKSIIFSFYPIGNKKAKIQTSSIFTYDSYFRTAIGRVL